MFRFFAVAKKLNDWLRKSGVKAAVKPSKKKKKKENLLLSTNIVLNQKLQNFAQNIWL